MFQALSNGPFSLFLKGPCGHVMSSFISRVKSGEAEKGRVSENRVSQLQHKSFFDHLSTLAAKSRSIVKNVLEAYIRSIVGNVLLGIIIFTLGGLLVNIVNRMNCYLAFGLMFPLVLVRLVYQIYVPCGLAFLLGKLLNYALRMPENEAQGNAGGVLDKILILISEHVVHLLQVITVYYAWSLPFMIFDPFGDLFAPTLKSVECFGKWV